MSTDPTSPLARFCLTLEEYRRTLEGRVRGERDFVAHFFNHDANQATDLVFLHMPPEVRAPIVSGWRIRGPKSALRDDDTRTKAAVHDALVAGDVDAVMFESGVAAEVLIRWVPLQDWWSFWRAGNLSERAILKALSTGYDLALFDAGWFLSTLEMPTSNAGSTTNEPKRGIEVLAEGLSKADLTEWISAIHKSGDGSPRGLVAALGWEKIVRHTRSTVLIAVLDALAAKAGLKSIRASASHPPAHDPIGAALDAAENGAALTEQVAMTRSISDLPPA